MSPPHECLLVQRPWVMKTGRERKVNMRLARRAGIDHCFPFATPKMTGSLEHLPDADNDKRKITMMYRHGETGFAPGKYQGFWVMSQRDNESFLFRQDFAQCVLVDNIGLHFARRALLMCGPVFVEPGNGASLVDARGPT